jgi:hypothetical protein
MVNNNQIIDTFPEKTKTNSNIDKDNLLKGVWAENDSDNALFSLDGKIINYTEGDGTTYTYQVKDDTVVLNLDPIAKLHIIKLTKDSFWFKDNFSNDTTRLYRR